jgi:eukaryotic-like serine/threonine-protein kinase
VPSSSQQRKKQQRRRRTLTMTALLGLVTAWFFLLGPGAGTPLPSLVGLDQTAAEEAIVKIGAEFEVERSVFDEQVAAGTVLATSPGAGTRLREGAIVRVVLSKGPERYLVPDLVGMNIDQADAALAGVNLLLGERSEEFSDSVPAGRIVSTVPAAGAQTRGGSIVNIVVSKGKELIALADFVGIDADQAMAELGQAGFAPTTELVFSETITQGAVISQTPAPGKYPRGTAVALTISMGSELVLVPSVKGLTLIAAGTALENLGLRFAPTTPVSGLVTKQSIAAGEKVKRGTLITLTVKK